MEQRILYIPRQPETLASTIHSQTSLGIYNWSFKITVNCAIDVKLLRQILVVRETTSCCNGISKSLTEIYGLYGGDVLLLASLIYMDACIYYPAAKSSLEPGLKHLEIARMINKLV